ncbi:hypothetical protein [Caldiplasma sukawensis]
MGKSVIDIAWHYYAGLRKIPLEEAQEKFNQYLFAEDPLIESALRMAEREVMKGI